RRHPHRGDLRYLRRLRPGDARGRSDGELVGHGTAVAAVTGGIDLAGVPEVPAIEVGPERVEEDELGVGRLPEQVVGEALLTGGAQEEIDIGDVRLVEVAREDLFVDLVRVELAGGDVTG